MKLIIRIFCISNFRILFSSYSFQSAYYLALVWSERHTALYAYTYHSKAVQIRGWGMFLTNHRKDIYSWILCLNFLPSRVQREHET